MARTHSQSPESPTMSPTSPGQSEGAERQPLLGQQAAVSDQLSLGTSQSRQGPRTGFLESLKPPGGNQGVRAHVLVFVARLRRFPQALTSSCPWRVREPAGRPPAVLSGTPCPPDYSAALPAGVGCRGRSETTHSTHLDNCITSSALALQSAFIWGEHRAKADVTGSGARGRHGRIFSVNPNR